MPADNDDAACDNIPELLVTNLLDSLADDAMFTAMDYQILDSNIRQGQAKIEIDGVKYSVEIRRLPKD